ncbi:DUF1819 family protein [Mangrovibacterium marinum]|uniref:Putative inner membrane protein DUF1819 n=1 Tax=Mangrovibacterium marinum TaxID=1639118 RepID=A0A2T5BV75_9BACT|nr:DUF1819 family protein [Mangrovibacterium marinum]PTN03474.1 putative inner membrane protein DUF1819 [Mangrovibacterium marinum]
MDRIGKYDFSYTGFSLRVNDMAKLANTVSGGKDIDFQELGDGKAATGKRRYHVIKKRLATLSRRQVDILASGSLAEQRHIAFLAACKAHLFVRDFTVEVIREKLFLYDHELTEGEYISFVRSKAELHPEMEKLTETTQKKIKQVTFKMLEQAGIIDNVKSKMIQPQLPDENVIRAIAEDNKEWLKVLLMSDLDIENQN